MTDPQSYHSVLSGDGALEFARERGFPCCDQNELISGYARKKTQGIHYDGIPSFINHHYAGKPNVEQFNTVTTPVQLNIVTAAEQLDTVTAVAMDTKGHLACALSTGKHTYEVNVQGRDLIFLGKGLRGRKISSPFG